MVLTYQEKTLLRAMVRQRLRTLEELERSMQKLAVEVCVEDPALGSLYQPLADLRDQVEEMRILLAKLSDIPLAPARGTTAG